MRTEIPWFVYTGGDYEGVDIFIHIDDLGGAENGEKVLVEMTDWPERMNNPVGRVIKRLGKPGDKGEVWRFDGIISMIDCN